MTSTIGWYKGVDAFNSMNDLGDFSHVSKSKIKKIFGSETYRPKSFMDWYNAGFTKIVGEGSTFKLMTPDEKYAVKVTFSQTLRGSNNLSGKELGFANNQDWYNKLISGANVSPAQIPERTINRVLDYNEVTTNNKGELVSSLPVGVIPSTLLTTGQIFATEQKPNSVGTSSVLNLPSNSINLALLGVGILALMK